MRGRPWRVRKSRRRRAAVCHFFAVFFRQQPLLLQFRDLLLIGFDQRRIVRLDHAVDEAFDLLVDSLDLAVHLEALFVAGPAPLVRGHK